MSDPTKDEIAIWLDKIGKDRDWLGKQCGASKGTVDSWFSKRGFTKPALITIRRLMTESNMQSGTRILASFTTEEFELIEAARKEVGDPPRPQFYRDAILEYTESILNKEGEPKISVGSFEKPLPADMVRNNQA